MHRATSTAVLSAVVIAAALALGGCSKSIEPPPASPVTLTPITTQEVAPPAPLPPPEALIDVMVRLTDPDVPGTDKLGLIQFSTPEDAAAMDRFDKAVSDGGFGPLTFEATDLQWAQRESGNVQASFVIKTANPKAGEAGDFKFPLEFSPGPDTWQLTRESADSLLEFGGPAPSATPPPAPLAPPAPPTP